MNKWEYALEEHVDEGKFTQMGEDGWELVSAMWHSDGGSYYGTVVRAAFKRPVKEPAAAPEPKPSVGLEDFVTQDGVALRFEETVYVVRKPFGSPAVEWLVQPIRVDQLGIMNDDKLIWSWRAGDSGCANVQDCYSTRDAAKAAIDQAIRGSKQSK